MLLWLVLGCLLCDAMVGRGGVSEVLVAVGMGWTAGRQAEKHVEGMVMPCPAALPRGVGAAAPGKARRALGQGGAYHRGALPLGC